MLQLFPVVTARLVEPDFLFVLAFDVVVHVNVVLFYGLDLTKFVNNTSRRDNDGQFCPPAIRSS